MTSLEFIGKVAFLTYCGTPWRRWPFPFPPPGPDPGPLRPPPLPWFDRVLGNLHYAVLGGLVLATAAAHPKETFSLQYGGFLLVPAVQVVSGLYWNNAVVERTGKVKE